MTAIAHDERVLYVHFRVSDAKLAANRANAKKSTGPKSDFTKKIVSLNALRHGLTSARACVPGDNVEVYDAVIESHHARYAPVTDEERELVQIIAENAWRILKVAPEEAAIYDVGRIKWGESLFKEITDPERRTNLVNAEIGLIYEKDLRNLRLHERRLRSQQEKDIANLTKMQADRLEREARETKEAAEAETAMLDKARLIIRNCAEQHLPCDLLEFGFVFSAAELNEADARNFAQYKVTGEFMNVMELINHIRQTAA